MDMNPNEYQALCHRTECDQDAARHRMFGAHVSASYGDLDEAKVPIRLNHGVLGIVKEGGELLSLVEKWLYYGQTMDRDRIKDELGDVMWYVSLVCNAVGLPLQEVMEANVRKLSARYPEKYTDELAANRDREAEAKAVKASATRHEFDSSMTCNFCGVAEERVGRGEFTNTCPAKPISKGFNPIPSQELEQRKKQAKDGTRIVQDGHGFGHVESDDLQAEGEGLEELK